MLKFSCEKSLLVSAISVASRTVAAKSPFTVLEGLYLRAAQRLSITGYNLETGITVDVPAEISAMGECVMPARLFFDIIRKLPVQVFKDGKCVYDSPSVMEIRAYCQHEKDTLWEEGKRLTNPHRAHIDLSNELFQMKAQLLDSMSTSRIK